MKNIRLSNRLLTKNTNYRLTRIYLCDIINIVNNFQKTKSISK